MTVPNYAFACGVTIESLSAQSCDSNWIPGFMPWEASTASYKLVELTNMAVYWDPIQPSEVLLGNLEMADLTV